MAKRRKGFMATQSSGYSKRQWRQYREILMMGAMAIIVCGCYFIWSMSPVWQSAGQAAVPSFVSFVGVIFYTIQIGFWIAVVIGGLWGAAKVYGIYSESKLQWARPNESGFFPLQTIDANGGGMAGFFGGLMGNSYKMVADINKIPTGILHPMIETPRMDSNQQLAFAVTVEKAKTFSTIAKNNMRAATARAALSNMDRHHNPKASWSVVEEPVAPIVMTEVNLIDAKQAFNQSTESSWIVGQNRATGDLCKLNPWSLVHWSIFGGTGTGKTSRMALLLMANAIKYGWRVQVWDGKGGSDWANYGKYIDLLAMNVNNVGDAVGDLFAEYESRQVLVNRERANNIRQLQSKVAPILVLADEFGTVMRNLKAANRQAHEKVATQLSQLASMSRSTGISLVLMTQDPTRIDSTVLANMPDNFCFKVGGSKAQGLGEYNLNQLDRNGEFQTNGERFHAFDTFNVINQLLPINYRKPDCMVTGFSTSVSGAKTSGVSTPVYVPPTKPAPPTPVQVVQGGVENFPDVGNGNSNNDVVSLNPLLKGPATNRGERLLVKSIFEREGSKNKATKALWGSKNKKTLQWLDEALAA